MKTAENGTLAPVNRLAERQKRTIILNDPNLSAIGILTLNLKGQTPLLMHRFSEKAQDMMLGKQMGKAQGKKAKKDPEEDFLQAMYVIGERPKTTEALKRTKFGVPAIWFKQAAVRGAKVNDMAMTDARCAFFVLPTHGDLVELECSTPKPRADPVRVQQTADIRIRPEFEKWALQLKIEYNARLVSAEQLISWFIAAGKFNGVGDWRPNGRSSTGTFGCFEVVKAEAEEPKING